VKGKTGMNDAYSILATIYKGRRSGRRPDNRKEEMLK
jgi:hypothetical protein